MANGTYAYTGTIEKDVTVNTTGTYDITAYGAKGGATNGGLSGGVGAEVEGSFTLTANERLEIVVGGAGAYGSSTAGYGNGGGGGGGSFVLASTDGGATYHLLLAAGGGGGAYHSAGGAASFTAASSGSGAGGATGGGPNGPDGGGYHMKLSAGGGSGYEGAGYTGRGGGGSNRTGGYAGGTRGSPSTYTGGNGGFGGGGGGGGFGGGGGGGYTGGRGGYYVGGGHTSGTYSGGGGGGTSKDTGTAILALSAATENAAHAGNGEILISPAVACYCRGTLIATDRGEVPVEALAVGDKVVTAAGVGRMIKWIGRRSYGGRFVLGRRDILPICIKAGALADNVPGRDLWISPNHAMYFNDEDRDGMLIEAKDLVNGGSIVQAERVEKVEYFHIELETHDVIIAEGALSETFIDDDNRFMFHNGHEYGVLYPAAEARPVARYCAPRCDGGYEVEAVRQRIASRAGLAAAEQTAAAGALRGYVDRITNECVAGWAQSLDHPEAPVCLDIFAGGLLIGQVLANRYRADLEQAGMGSGHHSFEFTPSDGVAFAPDAIEVRRSLDGVALEMTIDTWRMLRRTA